MRRSVTFIILNLGLSFSVLLSSRVYGKIPKECIDLFDQKIKHLKGKPECLFSCLSVKVNMGTFLCTSTDSYCKEYCNPYNDPLLVHFDGRHLKIVQDCSNVLGVWKAVSGGADENVILFPWTKVQGGPVPKGRYFIDPKEITEPSIRRPIFLLMQRSWGKFRVPLHPAEGTKVFGRSGFFIHGGKKYGSEGCVDLDGDETPFFTWLKKQRNIIPVKVKYD